MYEKFYRLGWLGYEGNSLTRGNSSPYKQALTLTMKSFFDVVALKCDFGTDTLLFRRADFRETATFQYLPPCDNMANLHYNVKIILAVIVN